METNIRLVVPGAFPPGEYAREAMSGLRLPAIEAILARGAAAPLRTATLEAWLCASFGAAEGAVAPVTLLADGGQPGAAYWLRADPVHLMLRGSEILLRPVAVLDADEAAQMCASLNQHFRDDGLYFTAPQPQRWYLRLQAEPGMGTYPLAQVAGRDIGAFLPHGPDALHWHRLLNEIQMLLSGHPVNDAREQRGDWIVNSIWPWGGGFAPARLCAPYARMLTDSELAAAFAQAAGLPLQPLAGWRDAGRSGLAGELLIVWDGMRLALQHGDLGGWRASLHQLEQELVQPLWRDLRLGRIRRVSLDLLQGEASRSFAVTPGSAWQFWRGRRRLAPFAG